MGLVVRFLYGGNYRNYSARAEVLDIGYCWLYDGDFEGRQDANEHMFAHRKATS